MQRKICTFAGHREIYNIDSIKVKLISKKQKKDIDTTRKKMYTWFTKTERSAEKQK